jgi:hypothetical protein
MDCWGPRRAAS